MSFTNITKPTQGDPTKKSIIDALIDNCAYFKSEVDTIKSLQIPNGSFEIDVDADGTPDRWTKTLFTGGSFTLDSTDSIHGKYAAKFTSPGGAGNGGGYLVSQDYFEVSPNTALTIYWEMKSSVAGVKNIVTIQYFDKDKISVSDVELYNEASSNPTTWTTKSKSDTPPSTARFAKLKITGCDNTNTTAGSTWYDEFRIEFNNAPAAQYVIAASGAYTWTCPANVRLIRIRLWGGGGGGNASNGGSSGAYAEAILSVTSGANYTGSVGAAGASGGGSNGGATTFISPSAVTLISAGGGTGNSGGAQTGGTVTWDASIAASARHAINGSKGNSTWGAPAPNGGGIVGATGAGIEPGGGGYNSSAGSIGRVVIQYIA